MAAGKIQQCACHKRLTANVCKVVLVLHIFGGLLNAAVRNVRNGLLNSLRYRTCTLLQNREGQDVKFKNNMIKSQDNFSLIYINYTLRNQLCLQSANFVFQILINLDLR